MILALVMLALVGCNTMRGAPEPPFKSSQVWTDDAVKAWVDALAASKPSDVNCKQTRDYNAIQLIALIDVNYMHYRQGFVFDKQQVQAISSGLQLMMTIAGGLTNSTGVKDNYLAGIALMTGGEAIYDKSFLFEKTAPALASQMDASRKLRLSEILAKLEGYECQKYPAQVALSDILDYYFKGTLIGAITATQKDAEAKDADAQKALNAINEVRLQRASDP
jgi:hypothetical protein